MKKKFFLAILSIALISCSKDDLSNESNAIDKKEQITVLNFPSFEEMENKIDDIYAQKFAKEKIVLENFNQSEVSKYGEISKTIPEIITQKQIQTIANSLKEYHNLKLLSIYELRNELNFTSLQSIVDEINSLNAVDSNKAENLFKTHQKLLTKNKDGIVKTIFDERTATVLNTDGEVLINSEKINYNEYYSIPDKTTGKYRGDERVFSNMAASNGPFFVYYSSGREYHTNTFGFRYYKYFTELKAYFFVSLSSPAIECPSNFIVIEGSKAGFIQENDNIFSPYSFTYDYISGTGVSVRNVGGNKNTKYKPAGGSLEAIFTTTVGGVYHQIECDLTYQVP